MSADSSSGLPGSSTEPSPRWRALPDGMLLRTPGRRTLWVEGDPLRLRGPRIAVIGSRTPTEQQIAVAAALCGAMSAAEATVCSGGALGIDAVAHRSTLKAGGVTVLVSPIAIGQVYPLRHDRLFQEVRDNGLLISPFGPDDAFRRSHFRTRNTVLARLVDALIVICADQRSGSLHCARQAWKLGLPVFAVPWHPGSLHAEGTNLLLSAGARAIVGPEQAADVVTRLRAGTGQTWLKREEAPPVLAVAQSKDALKPDAKRPDAAAAIDAEGGRWQRYAPAGLQSRHRDAAAAETEPERQPEELKALIAPDEDGAVRLALRQQRDGVSLEELVVHTGRTRSDVARLLLHWTLAGSARRDTWGRYHDG